jgi:hypothetical protein
MTGHAFPASRRCQYGLDIHTAAEYVVPNGCTRYDSENQVCLLEEKGSTVQHAGFIRRILYMREEKEKETNVVCHEHEHQEEGEKDGCGVQDGTDDTVQHGDLVTVCNLSNHTTEKERRKRT